MRTRLTAAVLFLGLLTACVNNQATTPATDDVPASSSPTAAKTDRPSAETPSSPSARPAEPGTKVIAAESDFGKILFDETGQAIYLFDIETTTEPRCYEACADAWPPFLPTAPRWPARE